MVQMAVNLTGIEPIKAPARGFSTSEFEQRLANVQKKMQDHDFDVILLTNKSDIEYFSGFQTQFWQSPTRPWFLLIPQQGELIAVIPTIGQECMARTWIKDIRTWSSPNPKDDGVSLLAETILEIAASKAKVGILSGLETKLSMPLNDFEKLKTNLTLCTFEDATGIVQNIRSIKSDAEIEKIKQSAMIASNAFELIPSKINSGMSEIEVFRRFKLLCLALGADDPAYLVGASSSAGYGDIISPPSEKKLAVGDVLILDVGCVWDGYFCDFDRNFAIGTATDQIKEVHRIVWDATEAGLEAAKIGSSCAEVFLAMKKVMQPQTIASNSDVGRLGHGLGLQLTEFPSLTSWDKTELKEGMVLTLEPGFAFAEGKMMVHEENIVIRKEGPELLSKRAPREIPIIK